ncbi:putative leucine-rich repeat-containing protein DDB_G0290503 [Ptychodera flava]|uniref:putative leucine-rich repeat-containing protein DDB_G0290503 n=1 Tax=Ptychodera flava TaxID=63121 RepID=UPI00396A31C3
MSLFTGMKLNVKSPNQNSSCQTLVKSSPSQNSKPVKDHSDFHDDEGRKLSRNQSSQNTKILSQQSENKDFQEYESQGQGADVRGDDFVASLDQFASKSSQVNSNYSVELAGLDLNFDLKVTDSELKSELDDSCIASAGRLSVNQGRDDKVDREDVTQDNSKMGKEPDSVISGFSFIQEPATSESLTPEDESLTGQELTENVNLNDNDQDIEEAGAAIPQDTTQPCYNLQLTQKEELELMLQTSQANIQSIRTEIAAEENKQNITLQNFQSAHMRHIEKLQSLKTLQIEQSKALIAEDFEKAEEIDKRVTILQNEVDVTPPMISLDNIRSFVKTMILLNDKEQKQRISIHSQLSAQKEQEEKSIEEEKQKFSTTFQKENADVEKEKSQLQKSLSHLSIDRKHLEQCENQLDSKISELTSTFVEKKQCLQEEMEDVKDEIAELERKLVTLREKEAKIATDIVKEEENIEEVHNEFQDERLKMKEEREKIEEQQILLDNEMEKLSLMEKELHKKKEDVETKQNQSLRNKETLERKLVEEMKEIEDLKGEEAKLAKITFEENDLPLLQRHKNEELERVKDKVSVLEAEVKDKMAAVFKLQTSVTVLRKRVNDIEEQIESLNESKKLAVAARNFAEAKHLSNEVKELTATGESCQKQLEATIEDVTINSKVLENLQEEFKASKDDLQKRELEFDLKIQENAVEAIQNVKMKMKNEDLSVHHNKLLEAIIQANYFLIKELCIKHDLEEPACVQAYLSHLQEEFEDKADDTGSKCKDVGDCDIEMDEEIRQEIATLEQELEEAVGREDYDTAHILSNSL